MTAAGEAAFWRTEPMQPKDRPGKRYHIVNVPACIRNRLRVGVVYVVQVVRGRLRLVEEVDAKERSGK